MHHLSSYHLLHSRSGLDTLVSWPHAATLNYEDTLNMVSFIAVICCYEAYIRKWPPQKCVVFLIKYEQSNTIPGGGKEQSPVYKVQNAGQALWIVALQPTDSNVLIFLGFTSLTIDPQMTTPFEVITIWPSLSLMLTPINTCTLSFPALSLYGTNYRKRLLMPLLFTPLKTLSHHIFIPHPFDIIITVFIAVCICRMYTCISFFVLFVHPLLVKHKSWLHFLKCTW